MTVLPLVARELKAEASGAFTYWARVLAAGTVVAAFGLTSLNVSVSPALFGGILFRVLNTALSLAIWLVVPLLTADCISREKREGTLGLLFLTPLSAHDILIGKALIHGLRALTLLLAALPLLGLPLFLGGIRWQGATFASMSHLSELVFALLAGLIASVRNTEWVRSLIMAEFFSGGFALLFTALGHTVWNIDGLRYLLGIGLTFLLIRYLLDEHPPRDLGELKSVRLAPAFLAGWRELARWVPEHLRLLVTAGLALAGCLFWGLLGLGQPLLAMALLIWALEALAHQLRENWQKELTSPPQPDWVKIFSNSEFWQSLFRWNTSRTLDRNPIAWLQEYSWTARLTKWGWLILMLVAQLFTLLADHSFVAYQTRLNMAIALGIAFSASGSFRRERETGALELLLVTPLQARDLVGGRLWGVWCHFLPAMAVLYSCWFMNPYAHSQNSWLWLFFGLSSFLLLPAIGLYFSILPMNFLVATLATAGVGLLLPWSLLLSVNFLWEPYGLGVRTNVIVLCGLQAVAALFAAWHLYRILSRREFVASKHSL
jgi:ABC-type transport system involved in multi-copper enzyme maturation permease subunit